MPDTRRTKVRTGGDSRYTPPPGPSISRFKDSMANKSKGIFAVLLGVIVVGSIAFFAGGPFGGGGGGGEAPASASDVVAHVSGDTITRADLSNAVTQMSRFREMYGMGPVTVAEQPQSYSSALDQLVKQKVELQAARTSGVKVSDADYEKKVNELVEQRIQAQRQSFTSPAAFDKYLKDNGKSLSDLQADTKDELYTQLQQQGIDLRQALTDDLMVQAYRDQKEHQLTLPRLAHYSEITLNTTPKTDARVKAQADQLTAQLKAGGDFAKLAKQYSSDTASKNKGGDMGWAPVTGSYVQDPLKAAAKAKVGDVLGPFKTASGYQIIKVMGWTTRLPAAVHSTAGQTPDSASSGLLSAADQAYQTYLDGLAKKATVVYDDPALAGAVAQSKVDNKTALADYKKALASSSLPADERGWVEYAVGQMTLSQNPGKAAPAVLHQALSAFQSSATADPSADAWIGVGDTELKLNDRAKAKAAYQAALKLAAGNQMALSQLAGKFHDMGDDADMFNVTKLVKPSPGMGGLMGSGGMMGGGGQGMPIQLSPSPKGAAGPRTTTRGVHPVAVTSSATVVHGRPLTGSAPAVTPEAPAGRRSSTAVSAR